MRTVVYNIKQAFTQINRNKGMSLASIFAITAMLLILGLFFVMTVNINLFSEMIKTDYDQIEIFLKDDVTADQADKMMKEIKSYKGVQDTSYRTKEDAMNIMKKRWGENGYLLDNLGDNPLPNSILITVDGAEAANSVSKQVQNLSGIEDVKYYKETIEKLTRITNYIEWGALIIMAFLVVVSVVVVANTIKLTVFAREREISIMKYIGASNWFIRGPFLVEGIIMGVISSCISVVIIYFIYKEMVSTIGLKFMTIFSSPLVPAGYLTGNLIIIFLAIGISIGACGSIISIRKFLDT